MHHAHGLPGSSRVGGGIMKKAKYTYTLISRNGPNGRGAGAYYANNIIALAWYVITHRFFHLFRGDGWVD